jgi:hypothetical protein
MNEFLTIVAASEGKRPTVSGVAYSGGKMRLFGLSRPVVVDMAGLAVPEPTSGLLALVGFAALALRRRRA